MYNGKYKVKYILNKKSKENHSIYYMIFFRKQRRKKAMKKLFEKHFERTWLIIFLIMFVLIMILQRDVYSRIWWCSTLYIRMDCSHCHYICADYCLLSHVYEEKRISHL